jgi:hypothetical protein
MLNLNAVVTRGSYHGAQPSRNRGVAHLYHLSTQCADLASTSICQRSLSRAQPSVERLRIDKDGVVTDSARNPYKRPAHLAADERTVHDEWLLPLVLSWDGEQHNPHSG